MARKRNPPKKSAPDAERSQHEINVVWVVNNFPRGDDDDLNVIERDAPSSEAWTLLQQYSVDSKSRLTFLDKFYRPLYVKDKEQSGEQQRADDKRTFFRIFSLLEAERPELCNVDFHRSSTVDSSSVEISPEPEPVAELASVGVEAGGCVVGEASADVDVKRVSASEGLFGSLAQLCANAAQG